MNVNVNIWSAELHTVVSHSSLAALTRGGLVGQGCLIIRTNDVLLATQRHALCSKACMYAAYAGRVLGTSHTQEHHRRRAPADAAPGLFLVFAEDVAGTEPLSRILSRSSHTWVRPKTSVNGLRRVCR